MVDIRVIFVYNAKHTLEQRRGRMTDIKTNIFEIPEQNIEKLRSEIAKINKRADKIGVPHVQIIEQGTRFVPNRAAVQELTNAGYPLDKAQQEAPKDKVYQISIEGEGPKIEGYTFVGSLDHYSLPGDVLIKTVPGEVIPSTHYDAQPICDHCGKIRPRNNTYVLRNDETGEHIQVGSHCVRDFIGYDPSQVARFLERVFKLVDDIENDEFGSSGSSGGSIYFDPVKTLALTNAVIRTYGWVSVSRAEIENTMPTATIVNLIIHPPKDKRIYNQIVNEIEWDEQSDEAEAQKAIDWILDKEDENEYITNLRKMAKAEGIPSSGFAMWVSLMATYNRAQEQLREKARQLKTNEWVGEVKERREFTVELVGTHVFDGQFGSVVIHRFVDDQGRTIIWFANTKSNMENGHTYRIVGTVKKHDQYNDWKQTHINRVKVKEDFGVMTNDE